jgi:hypothetical protein
MIRYATGLARVIVLAAALAVVIPIAVAWFVLTALAASIVVSVGVDAYAVNASKAEVAWFTEHHPAEWAKRGRSAGPIRNQAMADAGADLALGFILDMSKGSLDMLSRCHAARIPTIVDYRWREAS